MLKMETIIVIVRILEDRVEQLFASNVCPPRYAYNKNDKPIIAGVWYLLINEISLIHKI